MRFKLFFLCFFAYSIPALAQQQKVERLSQSQAAERIQAATHFDVNVQALIAYRNMQDFNATDSNPAFGVKIQAIGESGFGVAIQAVYTKATASTLNAFLQSQLREASIFNFQMSPVYALKANQMLISIGPSLGLLNTNNTETTGAVTNNFSEMSFAYGLLAGIDFLMQGGLSLGVNTSYSRAGGQGSTPSIFLFGAGVGYHW